MSPTRKTLISTDKETTTSGTEFSQAKPSLKTESSSQVQSTSNTSSPNATQDPFHPVIVCLVIFFIIGIIYSPNFLDRFQTWHRFATYGFENSSLGGIFQFMGSFGLTATVVSLLAVPAFANLLTGDIAPILRSLYNRIAILIAVYLVVVFLGLEGLWITTFATQKDSLINHCTMIPFLNNSLEKCVKVYSHVPYRLVFFTLLSLIFSCVPTLFFVDDWFGQNMIPLWKKNKLSVSYNRASFYDDALRNLLPWSIPVAITYSYFAVRALRLFSVTPTDYAIIVSLVIFATAIMIALTLIPLYNVIINEKSIRCNEPSTWSYTLASAMLIPYTALVQGISLPLYVQLGTVSQSWAQNVFLINIAFALLIYVICTESDAIYQYKIETLPAPTVQKKTN